MARTLFLALAAAGIGLLHAGDAVAGKRDGGWYHYAVPFTCGMNGADVERAVPATYATAVNVLNPGDEEAVLAKHVALSFPPVAQLPGDVSEAIVETLPGLGALQVDCGEIPTDFLFPGGAPAAAYVQGFLVLRSSARLDVSAVYTATGATGEVSLDVEQVDGRPFDARELDDDNGKVDVCHVPRGNPGNAHTISVGASAVPAHLKHGDSLGACGSGS